MSMCPRSTVTFLHLERDKKYDMKILLIGLICFTGLLSCYKDKDNNERYRFSEKIMVDGIERTYTIQLPVNYYDDSLDRPVIFGLHCTGGSGLQFEEDYDFSDKTNREGVIAIYPDGVQKTNGRLKLRSWNAGSCCDYAMHNNINDVKFIT